MTLFLTSCHPKPKGEGGDGVPNEPSADMEGDGVPKEPSADMDSTATSPAQVLRSQPFFHSQQFAMTPPVLGYFDL